MIGHVGVLLTACLLDLAVGAAAGRGAGARKPAVRYLEPCEGVAVVWEQAPVKLANTVVATVERGRRFGVMERKGDLFRIQVFTGKNLRYGWIQARHVRRLANADVDLAAEALQIARELNPKVDVAACRARVAALAAKVRAAAQGAPAAAAKLQAIRRVLFGEERFAFEISAHAFDAVLAHKRGNCLSLSVLTLSLARELKLPLCAVVVPKHAFVRYDDGRQHFNVEPSMGGVFVGDAYVKGRCRGAGGVPKLLSHMELVGLMMAQAANDLYKRGQHARAATLFARAVELAPVHSETYHNWGTALLAMKKPALACDKFARAVQVNPRAAASLYTWGVALATMGERTWACEKFARAVEADPRSATAYYNWGLTLLQMGKRTDGLAKLRQAVALSPGLKPQVEELLRAVQHRPSDVPAGRPGALGDDR